MSSCHTTHDDEHDSEIRVVIENSEYWLRNNGDLAMMAVTIRRIRERWPNARIGVLTETPALLSAYFPDAQGITGHDTRPWAEPGRIELAAARLGSRMAGPAILLSTMTADRIQRKIRSTMCRLREVIGSRPTMLPPDADGHIPDGCAAAVRSASLVLCLGGGYLTDADVIQTRRAMGLIDYARSHDVPVALVGQGFGPINDPALMARVAATLPHVGFFALRERVNGPGLLDQIGMPTDRTMVSGDDAIELAYAARTDSIGTKLGFCLRVAGYSSVATGSQSTVGLVIRGLARDLGAGIAPLVISENGSEDRRSTLPLVRHAPGLVRPLGRFVHPLAVARRVSTCRIVVTGAYHLAVFALSQGIPVVALSSTPYYDAKFVGLGDMFGGGLELVDLNDPQLAQRLTSSIRSAWAQAADARSALRARARIQIDSSKEAFAHVFELVESRRLERT